MLEIEGLTVSYGRNEAVRSISLAVPAASITALVGSNGAGKTSTLNAITGLVPSRGRITMNGKALTGLTTDDIVRLGVAQVAEGRQLFPLMSVRENLELGGYLCRPAENRQRMADLMNRFPVLAERANQHAGTLSGGEQQIVAICRALMSAPRVLLIDEPCLGLAPIIVRRVASILRDLHGMGLTILLAEQNASFAAKVADNLILLENGRVRAEGAPGELLERLDIRQAYMGVA
ncbi:MAG: ABC transporter ATP-binding protein [Xanthobacteraceae bacterium]